MKNSCYLNPHFSLEDDYKFTFGMQDRDVKEIIGKGPKGEVRVLANVGQKSELS